LPAGARALLAGLVLAAGMGLAIAGWDDRATSKKVAEPPEFVLEVNHAPRRALAALPHLGPTLANRLVEARAERPFASLEEVRARVRGIGPVTLARIAPHLRIEDEPGPKARSQDLASARSDRPSELPRASRRKVTRARRPASTPSQPRLLAGAQGADTQPPFTVADRE
jgi:competence protein ComEA